MSKNKCVIIVHAFANGEPCPIAGQYLKSFDFEAHGGIGFGDFTHSLADAKVFDSAADAAAFWNTPSQTVPFRADGRPNKPFSGCTIEIIPLMNLVQKNPLHS